MALTKLREKETILPHGGELISRELSGEKREAYLQRISTLPP